MNENNASRCTNSNDYQYVYKFKWLSLMPSTLLLINLYLKCMLVFKSLHGLAPAYSLNEFSCMRNFHSTRVTEICSICRYSCSRAKIWNRLPLAQHEERALLKWVWVWPKKALIRPKPNWASNTFAILSCSNFFICYCLLCCFFFHQGPIQTSLTELGTPD